MPITKPDDSLKIATDLPLVLFPVRLETHFKDNDLLIRVYPDTVHVDSFEPELTEIEIKKGEYFWRQTWLAGKNEARERSAWAQLAEQFGSARAAWIAKVLQPENPSDCPAEPLPADSALPIEPEFPKVATHPEAWTRAPYTKILPDKWIALIYQQEDSAPCIFEGNPIQHPLDVGISPKQGLNANTLKKDEKIGWLVDFDKAAAAGMGLRITSAPREIKRLIVLGVKESKPGEDGQQILQDLIQAHHHTQGISFLRQGTPTNNTDGIPSGYSTLDSGFENSYRIERKASLNLIDGSNRAVTAKALGVDDDSFTHVREADTVEQFDAKAMNTALWQATWGYFLEQMMAGPDAPSEQTLQQARSHFEQYVRARGPLPALRIGTQPYGLLPATSLKHWRKPGTGENEIDTALAAFLLKLQEIWRNSLTNVSSVPAESGSLQSILNLTPVSVSYHRRPAQRIALLHSQSGTEPHNPDNRNPGNQTSENKIKDFGLTWTPRQIRMVLGDYPISDRWPGEIFDPTNRQGNTGQKYQDFCQELINKKFTDIQNRILSPETDSLFYWLIREACLREYLVTACRILGLPPQDQERLEAEYEEGGIPGTWSVLERSEQDLNSARIVDYLDNLKTQLKDSGFELQHISGIPPKIAVHLKEFAAFYKSLDYLSQQPGNILDVLFRETLDLCSHRYDAWVTSLASKQLESLRKQNQKTKGLYLGGYGWVEDLKPAEENLKSHGFVHAPSLAHATTAALLRSGLVSHNRNDREAYAVNLSSKRVRTALSLLDGVRQGQSLGALLGYRFERGLHENHPGNPLDFYIPFFRKIAALRPATQVVDGLGLLHKWQNDWQRKIPWGQYELPAPDSVPENHKKACQDELERLEDTIDAIGDLVLAESVHQIAQGNPVRAGATLSAIAEGEAPPPELDVIRTPRTGIAITHRIAVIFTGLPEGPVWGPQTARARAEPFLNAWAAQLFGPHAPKAVCSVEYRHAENSSSGKPQLITLDQLGLAPIDLLYLPESEGDAQRSELEQRIIYLIQQILPVTQTPVTEIKLNFTPILGTSDSTLSFAEVLEVARVIRKLITASHVLSPRNLAQPGQSIPLEAEEDTVRIGESTDLPLALSERIKLTLKNFTEAYTQLFTGFQEDQSAVIDFGTVRKRLEQLSDMIDALAEDSPERLIDCKTIRDNLMQLSLYSLADAIPIAPAGETPKIQKTLLFQLQSILDVIERRCDRIKTLTDSYNNLKPEDKTSSVTRNYHVARMHEIFGREFHVLPRFNPVNAADLRTTFLASNELQNNNPLASVTWFQRIARVREGAARLDAGLMYTEAIGGGKLEFTVGQLPYQDKEQWVALDGDLSGSRVSLVAQMPAGLDFTNPVAGLLIDEWVEIIPSKEEITGVAFHYNVPQSRAPQAILLAVPPPDAPSEWNLGMLADTLIDTMELAKMRMVDLSCLLREGKSAADLNGKDSGSSCKVDSGSLSKSNIGQFLPALYFNVSRSPEWKK